MTLAERAAALLGSPATTSYAVLGVEVDRSDWVVAAMTARDELGLDFFDLLTAVDRQEQGLEVVLRLWSTGERQALVLRTRCPVDDLTLPSLAAVYGGAAWHERATAEMFGLDFPGHPDLTPLLLPDGFEGHPLRKDFLLTARVDKPWPGAKEPGESDADLRAGGRRRRARPLGVPGPGGPA